MCLNAFGWTFSFLFCQKYVNGEVVKISGLPNFNRDSGLSVLSVELSSVKY